MCDAAVSPRCFAVESAQTALSTAPFLFSVFISGAGTSGRGGAGKRPAPSHPYFSLTPACVPCVSTAPSMRDTVEHGHASLHTSIAVGASSGATDPGEAVIPRRELAEKGQLSTLTLAAPSLGLSVRHLPRSPQGPSVLECHPQLWPLSRKPSSLLLVPAQPVLVLMSRTGALDVGRGQRPCWGEP